MQTGLISRGFLPFHEQVALRVETSPDSIAIRDRNSTLTYRELQVRSSAIQAELQARGIKRGDIVAIVMPRSLGYFVSALGVLAAGACFLPIDTEYPVERILFMLNDADPACIITTASLSGSMLASHQALDEGLQRVLADGQVLRISTDGLIEENLLSIAVPKIVHEAIDPSDAAYVIYTSGSTGTPKGVVVEHQGIPLLAYSQIKRFNVKSSSLVLQFSTLGFDAVVMEMTMAFTAGATLVLTPTEERVGPDLGAFISRMGITHALLPPSLLPLIDERDANSLEVLIVGGEACSPDEVERWSRRRQVYNAYGPTETTACATISKPLLGNVVPPLGGAVSGTEILILDGHLQMCSEEELGELYVIGSGLARGYLGQAALTASRFVANPFGPPGSRMYRTGDLARRSLDRLIYFEGRSDEQVKIRGVRVELSEVTAAIQRQPEVRQAVVVASKANAEELSLHGYVVLHDNVIRQTEKNLSEIQEWRELYDDLYQQQSRLNEESNFSGWSSSYTGAPIDRAEMEDWRTQTVARIRQLRPKNILEVGFGSGLLLERLLGDVESYFASEISLAAIENLKGRAAEFGEDWNKVVLFEAEANSMAHLPKGQFDVIVLNSVVQYFPNKMYTTEVINGLLDCLCPDGSLFIGDVRNADLATCFAYEIEIQSSDHNTSPNSILTAVKKRLSMEKELLLSPGFFHTLAKTIKNSPSLEIRIKGGAAVNELTKYRYDVILHKEKSSVLSARNSSTLVWGVDVANIDSIFSLLDLKTTSGPLRISRIPNPRIFRELQFAETLQQCELPTVGDYSRSPVLPDYFAIVEAHPCRGAYEVAWTWAPQHGRGYVDLVLVGRAGSKGQRNIVDLMQEDAATAPELDIPTVHELNTSSVKQLASIKAALALKLPSQMVPVSLTALNRMPRTPNGKVDLRALPPPVYQNINYDGYRTNAELAVSKIFADILALEDVKLDANFFDLGGHSLLATRLVRRVRAELGLPVSVATLFQAQTVRKFARAVQVTVADPYAPLLPLRPFGTGVPLFCFHPITGVSWGYANMLTSFRSGGSIFGVQAEGLNSDRPLTPNVESMVENYTNLIKTAFPAGPYQLMGYSSGGLFAHMVATELQSQGRDVSLLVIIDTYPTVEVRAESVREEDVLQTLLGDGQSYPRTINATSSILEFYRQKGGLFEELSERNVDRIKELTRATLAQVENFKYKLFQGDVLLFKSKLVPIDEVSKWKEFVSGNIEVIPLAWTHAKLLDAEAAGEIGSIVAKRRAKIGITSKDIASDPATV